MGTYACLYGKCCKGIPEDKRLEFQDKIEKVFQSGGMMNMESWQLFGKQVRTIHKTKMYPKGMNFTYNYFEDDSWENAGFHREENCVYSEKIGEKHFHTAVVSAYVLEEQYTADDVVVIVDGDPVASWEYVGWLNYLFDEQRNLKNYDAWKIFEIFYYSKNDFRKRYWENWDGFGARGHSFISGCEIYAVICGVDKALARFKPLAESNLEKVPWDAMKRARDFLHLYAEKLDEQCCREMIQIIRELYIRKDVKEVKKLFDGKYEKLITYLNMSDAPAFIVKGISEVFNKEFKELWDEIKEVVHRRHNKLYGSEDYYVIPISTMELFEQAPDDMIYYWEDDGKIIFSDELREWFGNLREEYNSLLEDDVVIDHPLRHMVELLEEAFENYYNIFAFTEFFEESIDNLSDKRYQTLWRLFDNMIHDEELKKAGDVIFVPDGPGHEHEGVQYYWNPPKRRLISLWEYMDPSKKKNKARVTLRRYLALVANRKLREKVFGF